MGRQQDQPNNTGNEIAVAGTNEDDEGMRLFIGLKCYFRK